MIPISVLDLSPVPEGSDTTRSLANTLDLARGIIDSCKPSFRCFYEEKDSIGKRYRRMDALGTPFCITVDHQTKEDNTVTVRHRDSMLQERIPIDAIKGMVLGAIA